MEELVIGVPARNEGATVGQLADALQTGCAQLEGAIRCELVLADQSGNDDTVERWWSSLRMPQRVIHCPEGLTGKGRNVKLLIRHALETGAHLMLVDADLRSYPPSNVGLFLTAQPLEDAGIVLPLWCRPRGHGNSTDFLACPLLFAVFGARVRQPLAGQMLLSRRFLETLDVESLPDDYGIDIALTMSALEGGFPVKQVVAPFPEHEGGGNSHRIMADVASAVLCRLAGEPVVERRDVRWPERYWEQLSVPPPSSRSLRGLIEDLAPTEPLMPWRELFDAQPKVIEDLWCDRLAAAVRRARTGAPVRELADELGYPFLVHAEYRRRLEVDLAGAEGYIVALGDRLAAAVS